MAKSTPASTSSSKASFTVPQPQSQATDDDLGQNSKPYDSLPPPTSLPQTDHFILDSGRPSLGGTTDTEGSPLPGHFLKAGVPAPPNARLSLGLGLSVPATPTRRAQPTTTIRLVSNPLADQPPATSYAPGENGTPQLKPFQTAFDITFGSPVPSAGFGFGFSSLSSWPPRSEGEDVEMGGIYPKLTFDDLPPVTISPSKPSALEDMEVNIATPASPTNQVVNTQTPTKAASTTPFVFGSPLPQHNISNTQFKSVAASVLDEMNARLRAEGVEEIDLNIVSKLHPDKKVSNNEPRAMKPIPTSKRGEISNKFEIAHQKEFEKMEGIDGVLKRRMEREKASPSKRVSEEKEEKVVVGRKRKSSVLEIDAPGRPSGPRRPSALANRPNASATRVISHGRRPKVIPGAFGMDDDDDEEDGAEEDPRAGKRVRMDPDVVPEIISPEEEAKRVAEVERQALELEKEKEAIKKKLEANRARRRSSAAHPGVGGRKSVGGAAGRKSIGRNGPRQSLLSRSCFVCCPFHLLKIAFLFSAKQKPKPSKFGFLSSAKSLVQSVWNRGKAPATTVQSGIPKPTAAPAPKPEPEVVTKGKEKINPPSLVSTKKSSIAPAKSINASASGSGGRVPPVRVVKPNAPAVSSTTQAGSIASSTRSRSRSPLPSFGTMSTLASSSSIGTGSGRNSLQSNASRLSSAAGTGRSRISTTNVSSVGTRLSATRVSATGTGGSGVGSLGLKKAVGSASRTSSVGTAASSSSRLSARPSTSSRLLAPTASSLAKGARRASVAPPAFGLKPVTENTTKVKEQEKPALGMITNSPAINGTTQSPRPGPIFSKPLLLPAQSGIPTPIKKRSTEPIANGMTEDGSSITSANTTAKPRSLNGRKPRISRSKVIARLASQRAASGSSTSSRKSSGGVKPRGSGAANGGRTRSSLGAKVSRASYSGAGGAIKGRASGGAAGVALSAKRRARQSEYLRRKSRGGAEAPRQSDESSMDVDSSR